METKYLKINPADNVAVAIVTLPAGEKLTVDGTEIIANINSSASLLSKRTLLENHPWVKDVDAELAAIKKQREQEMKDYGKDLFSDDDDGGDPGGDPNQK